MATPSSDDVAKLVGEIRQLKNSLDDTSIDRAEIASRYDDATKGLLTDKGELDAAAWAQLSADDQTARAATLARLKQTLTNAVAEADIPIGASSIMYKKYASNSVIVGLALFALFGLILDLCAIHRQWNIATAGLTVEKTQEKTGATPTPANSATPATKTTSPRTQPQETATPSPTPTAPAETVAAAGGTPSATSTVNSPPGTDVKGLGKPTEENVLLMVILLGALGGFLHLASSMANYVGNRQLLRSWVIYYFLIPFQGAALAPIVYLLLRVGVLNPANSKPGTASPADSLNLIGIYAFAALTGLFSKQAIEMMAEVFATIFKRVNAKDSLEKSKPEIGKDKGGKTDAT
jgi:hypothetical protein